MIADDPELCQRLEKVVNLNRFKIRTREWMPNSQRPIAIDPRYYRPRTESEARNAHHQDEIG